MPQYACPQHPDTILFTTPVQSATETPKGSPAIVATDAMKACPKCKAAGRDYYRYYQHECVLVEQKKG